MKTVTELHLPRRPNTDAEPVRPAIRPRRNSPCICGSGRKYKHCCMRRKPLAIELEDDPTAGS